MIYFSSSVLNLDKKFKSFVLSSKSIGNALISLFLILYVIGKASYDFAFSQNSFISFSRECSHDTIVFSTGRLIQREGSNGIVLTLFLANHL
jgi:hypothetical protein